MGVVDRAHGGAGQECRKSPALQDCRPRSVFQAVSPGSSWTLAAAESIHSRTPVLLRFSVRLPPVTARGRWQERGTTREG